MVVERPWLSLYTRFQARVAAYKEGTPLEEVHLAHIQHLPDELALFILSYLPPYTLGRLALVCRQWHHLVMHPRLWEQPCLEAFQITYPCKAALTKLATISYRRSWKRMFLEHPHLRFDGLFVSRNTYVRTAVKEWAAQCGPLLVVYFRYFRFFPDGRLLYHTSPFIVSRVAKFMSGHKDHFWEHDGLNAAAHTSQAHVFVGRYMLKGTKVIAVIKYPNNCSTEIRCRMVLRSTTPGANNRLDVESIVSFDRELGLTTSLDTSNRPLDTEPEANEATRREHKRGLRPCVFVPWEQVHTSVLNQPPSEMDFYFPG